MPSGLSETAIYNMVLDILTQETVLSTTDDQAIARWLNRNYPQQRDWLLEQHPWNFAVKRAVLAADTDTPAFEWDYQYTLPTDCLRMLPLTYDGLRDSPEVPHVVENGKLLTNKQAPLKVRYIARVTNPSFFTMNFANALAYSLATRMAYWMTGKAGYAKEFASNVNNVITRAQTIDSLEGTPEPPDDSDVINVR